MGSKSLSCGVLVVDKLNRILMLHATGQDFWDIPKGRQKEGESTDESAERELFEESSVVADKKNFIDLGWYPYNRHKELYLYLLFVDELDTNLLSCHSTFVDEHGQEVSEADGFEMVSIHDFPRRACKSMSRLYEASLKNDLEIMIRRHSPSSAVS